MKIICGKFARHKSRFESFERHKVTGGVGGSGGWGMLTGREKKRKKTNPAIESLHFEMGTAQR